MAKLLLLFIGIRASALPSHEELRENGLRAAARAIETKSGSRIATMPDTISNGIIYACTENGLYCASNPYYDGKVMQATASCWENFSICQAPRINASRKGQLNKR